MDKALLAGEIEGLPRAEVDGGLTEAPVRGLLEAEVDGALTAAEVDGALTAAEVDGGLLEAEVDGALTAAEVDGVLTAAEVDGALTEVPVEGFRKAELIERYIVTKGKEGCLPAEVDNSGDPGGPLLISSEDLGGGLGSLKMNICIGEIFKVATYF